MPSSRSPATSISSHRSSASSSSASLADSFDRLDLHDYDFPADCACSGCRTQASSNCAHPSWPKGDSFDQPDRGARRNNSTASSGMGSSHISDEDLLDCPDDDEIKRTTQIDTDADADADDCIAPAYHRAVDRPKQRNAPAPVVKPKTPAKVQSKSKESDRRK